MSGAEDGSELQNIIKQVTKERLQLERHLQIANDSLQRNNGIDLHKYLSLETTNQQLRQQLDSLDLLQQEHKLVEIQYREKEEACKELASTLKYKSALCQDLEGQLQRLLERNSRLSEANVDLQRKVVELRGADNEAKALKGQLSQVEVECRGAKSEVINLEGKVRGLEGVLAEMQAAGESRREIERQHREALEALKRRQDEQEVMATRKQEDLVEQLKVKIEHLEREKRSQNERHQELILEMAELKKYGGSVGTGSAGPDSMGMIVGDNQPEDNLEIDAIMAKLEQDNKFLEEIERQRARKDEKKPNQDKQQQSDSGSSSPGLQQQQQQQQQ